ncbi:hypothetical protein [Qiania dongpingensis]|uniref:Uncharacterized protein n=1 Tax=Qiania dongpingensis TaxID=2763669 RepID=A0A7G9G336_9FIRM|nr:hypothetical protein [Qiania dongpingensis]QNM05218.1 hypothetical protein H9Q78_12340 [Qiania dongpingensis]
MNKTDMIVFCSELDRKLDGFFEKAIFMYRENQERYENYCESYYDYLYGSFMYILNNHYRKYLESADLEELYLIRVFLQINDQHECLRNIEISQMSFQKIIEAVPFYELLIRLAPPADIWKSRTDRRWKLHRNTDGESLNFALNDSVWQCTCMENIMSHFLYIDFPIESLHNMNHDISYKTEGVYQALLTNELTPKKSKEFSAEYVNLVSHILEGFYLIDNRRILLDNVEMIEGDHSNDLEIIRANAYSNQSLYIHLNNWRITKNENTLKSFLMVMACNVHYVTGGAIQISIWKGLGPRDLSEQILSYIKGYLDEVKQVNEKYGMSLNRRGIYDVYDYAVYDDGRCHHPFHNDTIAAYVELLDDKDYDMADISQFLLENGYDRQDLREYMIKFIAKYTKRIGAEAVYNKLYALAVILEGLYWLKDILNYSFNEAAFGVSKLCNEIQSYIYKDDYGYEIISQEFEELKVLSLDRRETEYIKNKHQEFLQCLAEDLHSEYTVDCLLNLKYERITQLLNWGLVADTYDLMAEVTKQVLALIENQIADNEIYQVIYRRLDQTLKAGFLHISQCLEAYLQSDFNLLSLENMFKSILISMATAEFLFEKYVNQENESYIMDYSCIALEYFKALETIMNLVLYRPYRIKILMPMVKEDSSAGVSKKLKPYCGDSLRAIYMTGKKALKSDLEMGTLWNFYKNAINLEGPSKYLQNLQIEKNMVLIILEELDTLRPMRNKAAHGGGIVSKEEVVQIRKAIAGKSSNMENSILGNILYLL